MFICRDVSVIANVREKSFAGSSITSPSGSVIFLSALISAALLLKRKTVCALALGGVALVSAYLDTVKRAVVITYAVILAVLYGTADMLVCKFSSHDIQSFHTI